MLRKPCSVVKATEPFELLFPLETLETHTHEERDSASSVNDMSIDTSSEPVVSRYARFLY